MKFETIKDCLESFVDGYSNNDALTDAVNASRQSKEALENFLDERLWIPGDYTFVDEQAEIYYKSLAQIEERLVSSGLIYGD